MWTYYKSNSAVLFYSKTMLLVTALPTGPTPIISRHLHVDEVPKVSA